MTTAAVSKTRFRFVGSHLDDLADGRPLEPHQFYELTPDEVADPHNAQRISSGLLQELPPPTKTKGSGD